MFGKNVDEVEGVCENEASFLSTSSRTKTFIEFSMELLKDSMKVANSVKLSELEELAPPPSWSGIGGVGGLETGAPSAPHPREGFHLDSLSQPYPLRAVKPL